MYECYFMDAAKKGDLKTMKYLLSLGVKFWYDKNGALHRASANGHIEVVKYLHELGADIQSEDNRAVQWASEKGHLEIVMYLYEAGADIRSDNDYSVQAASGYGQLEVVMYLVSLGADITSDAVGWASRNDHFEVVKYLCEAREKISEKHKKYILFCEKMKNKIRERAQKKIYFWWIPICYDTNRECGKRMMQKNWEKTCELMSLV